MKMWSERLRQHVFGFLLKKKKHESDSSWIRQLSIQVCVVEVSTVDGRSDNRRNHDVSRSLTLECIVPSSRAVIVDIKDAFHLLRIGEDLERSLRYSPDMRLESYCGPSLRRKDARRVVSGSNVFRWTAAPSSVKTVGIRSAQMRLLPCCG